MKHCKDKGFSLIELLVVFSIFSVLSIMLSQSILTSIRSQKLSSSIQNIRQNGQYTVQFIDRLVKRATTITSSCEGVDQSIDEFTFTDLSGTVYAIRCEFDANLSTTRIGLVTDGEISYISSDSVHLGGVDCDASSLEIYCTNSIDGAPSVRIEFLLYPVVDSTTISPEAFSVYASLQNISVY